MKKEKNLYYEKINRVRPITRKEAKYYIKECDLCLKEYEKKKPLFLLSIHTYKNDEYLTFSNHIFTLEELNRILREFKRV